MNIWSYKNMFIYHERGITMHKWIMWGLVFVVAYQLVYIQMPSAKLPKLPLLNA